MRHATAPRQIAAGAAQASAALAAAWRLLLPPGERCAMKLDSLLRTLAVAAACAALGACGGKLAPSGAGGTTDAPLSSGAAITDSTGLCVDVQWAATDDGTPVQLWDCNGTAAQQWTLDGSGQLVGLAGKCLDVRWGDSTNGTPVQLYTCNGTA